MRVFYLLLSSFVALAAQAQYPAPTTPRVVRNLPYVANAGPRHVLDLYLPQHASTPCPLVIWIHGGGWSSGTKQDCPPRSLLPFGYAAASLEYRLSQDAIFPAQIEDCKAAIRWLRAQAGQYGIDPKRIGVWGGSAGGHLVALLGVTGRIKDFDTGENLDQSSAVQCVVDFFGPTDFIHWGNVPDPRLDTASSAIARLIGGTILTHLAAARSASPIYYVSKDAAPFLIVHGDKDPVVPLQQSQILEAALQKAGVASTLRVIPGGGHGGPGFGTVEVNKQILEFFNLHLKPQG